MRYTLKILGKSRVEYLLYDDFCLLNLNALINKVKFNKHLLTLALDEICVSHNKINLCGFSSLLYRLNIPYTSPDAMLIIKGLKEFFQKYYPFVYFCQNGVEFDGDIDIRPLEKLWYFDHSNKILYCHRMLFDNLEFLGFATNQITEVLSDISSLSQVLPKDIICKLPIETTTTLDTYHDFCEVLKC